MTVGEFMFLAIGLLLGVASGAALIEVIRARPSASREVRVTVAQDAIPRRRATTLADDAFGMPNPEPARGGPADRLGPAGPVEKPNRRANVAVPGGRTQPPRSDRAEPPRSRTEAPPPSGPPPSTEGSDSPSTSDGNRPTNRPDRMPIVATTDLEVSPSSGAVALAAENTSHAPVALLEQPEAVDSLAAPTYTGPCAEERRLAGERCELATRAQAQAIAAADALRNAQRAYDTHTSAATTAAEAADPRALRSMKEDAQRAFRAESRASTSRQTAESAARTWLQEINRINRDAAAAKLKARRERNAAAMVGATLERLGLEADSTRIGADMASAACLAARTAIAECDEQRIDGQPAFRRTPPPPTEPDLSGMTREATRGIALDGRVAPRIFRLLRGDPDAMAALVAKLSGDNPDELRRWKLSMVGLLDAILADAIEQAYLRFPQDHPFWGQYTPQQRRDITRALASLGHRFDGLGGWADDHLPTQRELSLALSYAGIDPVRVRQWPSERQTVELFHDVDVAADEYVAGVAGDLTLAEMVNMLGRRADGLVELWNHWGRIRPLLLEEV